VLARITANGLKIKSFRQSRHAFCETARSQRLNLKFNVELKIRGNSHKKGAAPVQGARLFLS
jgi:hypothetical protein